MKELARATIISLLLLILLAASSASADRPIYTGIPYPPSASTGAVTGRVTTSINQSQGLRGAYVAIVNTRNVSQEYANTTTDPQGDYYFAGVNVSSDLNAYEIYANISPYGEGYSYPFNVNAYDNPTTTRVIIMVPTPTPSPTPTPTSTPTTTSTPGPSPTSTSTPTLIPTPKSTPMPTLISTPTQSPTLSVASSTAMPPTPAQSATPLPVITTSTIPSQNITTPKPSPAISIVLTFLVIGLVAYYARNKRND